MKLAAAQRALDELQKVLGPHCVRLERAGSVRRRAPDVGDLELVAIPRTETVEKGQRDIFGGGATETVNFLHGAVLELVAAGRLRAIRPRRKNDPGEPEDDPRFADKADGKYWRLWLPRRRVQLDLWLVTRETWGVAFTLRTGAAAFGRELVTRWHERTGGRFHENRVCARHVDPGIPWATHAKGTRLAAPYDTPEEEDVFRVCGVEWVEPEDRVDEFALRALGKPKLRRAAAGTTDGVVTVPGDVWREWLAEGDCAGDDPADTPLGPSDLWDFTVPSQNFFDRGRPTPPRAGDRLYVVAHGKVRGWSEIVAVRGGRGEITFYRRGPATACTVPWRVRGFRGWRRRFWSRSEERDFPGWKTP